ncbi:MAG: glycosyltransferase family 2 protein [Candidatus Omnitrophica bacterium]|nr:glycosyltransferase family 2 protein [Candidatus Omnitrophota bacterium]
MSYVLLIAKLFFWIMIFLIVYSYFLYPIFLVLFSLFKKPIEVNSNGSYIPSVSMVISAYNEEKIIEEKIQNCLALDYPKEKLEIVVGSDGSTDNTARIFAKFSNRAIRFWDFPERMGKVNILNEIIPHLTSEIVVFSDANTMYEADAIKELVKPFSNPKIGCVCGKLILKKPDRNCSGEFEGFYWKYESFLKKYEGRQGSLLGANGGIYAIRKNLFEILPPNTIIEDFVLPMKILSKGYNIYFALDAIATEETSRSIHEESKRKIRIGAGAYQTLLMTLPMLNIFRGFPSFAYWSHKVIRWLVPFFLIALVLINLFLLQHGNIYQCLFYLQAIFYGGALAGYLLSKRKHQLKLFLTLYYFVAMNVSLLLGFFRFISGTQQVTWERAER